MSKIKFFLIFIILPLVTSLPLAFLGTIIIHAFWRWFEEKTGIESYGHSGPALWCYWADYTIIVIVSIFTLLKCHRYSKERK